jgi:parvulin-like peptidyl-prolyl isomerase
MSIMRMRKFFSRPVKVGKGKRRIQLLSPSMMIFSLLVIAFLIGTYYSFGPPSRAAGEPGRPTAKPLTATVATVNSTPINRRDYEMQLHMAERRMAQNLDPTRMRYVKSMVLQNMIDEHLKLEAVRRERIKVSAKDIEQEKDQLVEHNLKSRYPTTKELRDYLQRRTMSLEQLREQIRLSLPDDDLIRMQLQLDTLREQIESVVTLTDDQLTDSFTEVQARHILISPDSILEKAAQEGKKGTDEAATEDAEKPADDASISQDEAKEKARELAADLKQKLESGADFAQLAAEYSDDPGSAIQGGDLGWFKKGRMVPEFEVAAFGTESGKLAGPIETAFGFHIIKVDARRQDIPEDFEENKEMYREQALLEARSRAWHEYEQQLHAQATIEIVDPELKAYELLDQGNMAEGLSYLETAVAGDDDNISAAYELAQLYDQIGRKDEAIQTLEKVAVSETGASSAMVHMRLGEMLLAAEQKEKAIASLKAASDWARAYAQDDYIVHIQLQHIFEDMGQKDLAELEKEWIEGYIEHQSKTGGMDAMPFTIP